MPRFEVHIPASDANMPNLTLRVDADTWMAALKTGFQKLGEQGLSVQNVMVDVQEDNTLHVTDATSGRVFRIREMTEQEVGQAEVKKAPSLIPFPGKAPPPTDRAKTLIGVPPARMFAAPQVSAASPAPAKVPAPAPAPAPPLERTPDPLPAAAQRAADFTPSSTQVETPAGEVSPSLTAGRLAEVRAGLAGPSSAAHPSIPTDSNVRRRNSISAIIELEKPVAAVKGPIGRSRLDLKSAKEQLEDTLAEIFERVEEVHSRRSVEDGLYFLLDLALEKIPADSGSVYFADAGSGDLRFAAVRGPKAQELLRGKFIVPVGTGVAGFCSMEGVSVALSDVQKDPRFYSAISEAVDYETRSIVCSPITTHGRAFGAIQLINRKSGSVFTEPEVGMLAYIAHQAALYLNARS